MEKYRQAKNNFFQKLMETLNLRRYRKIAGTYSHLFCFFIIKTLPFLIVL